MKRWRIAPSDTPLSPAVVAHVVAGVGTPYLAANFLEAMHRMLPVTFCTVFAVGASGRLETVSAASSYGDTAERTASRYIAERFDRCDPHMLWLGARALPALGEPAPDAAAWRSEALQSVSREGSTSAAIWAVLSFQPGFSL